MSFLSNILVFKPYSIQDSCASKLWNKIQLIGYERGDKEQETQGGAIYSRAGRGNLRRMFGKGGGVNRVEVINLGKDFICD